MLYPTVSAASEPLPNSARSFRSKMAPTRTFCAAAALVLCSLLSEGPSKVGGTRDTCSKGCALPPKKGLVVTGTGTYSKSIGRQCPSQKAMLRHFVIPSESNDDRFGINADLQNEVDRAPFNLENTMVEFQPCKFEIPQLFDLRNYDFSDMYKFVERNNVTENMRRVNGQLVMVDKTGGIITTNIDHTKYRISAMEEITDLPDGVASQLKYGAQVIKKTDWLVFDNVTGSVTESPVFDSVQRKDGFFKMNFTAMNNATRGTKRFPYFGGDYSEAYLSSNGFITFGGSSDDYEGNIAGIFSKALGNPFADKSTGTVHRFSRRPLLLPRISGFYTDLEPETNRSGYVTNVTWMKVCDPAEGKENARLVITFNNVPLDTRLSGRGTRASGNDNWEGNTFQMALFPFTGKVRLAWKTVSTKAEAVIGLSPGIRPLKVTDGSEDFEQIELRDYFECVDNEYCEAEDETTVRLIGPTRPADTDVYIYGLRDTITLDLTKVHPFAVAQNDNPEVYNKFCSAGCTFYYTEGNWIQYLTDLGERPPEGVLNKTATLQSCLDRCDYTYRYNITVGGIQGGYSDVAEVARLECWDGCQIANLLCQPGFYCFQGEMIECPPGTYRHNDYRRVESCYLCPKGRYRTETAGRDVDMCALCPVGKYANYTGSDSVSDCQRCPAGKVGLTPGIFRCTCITEDSCEGDRAGEIGLATLSKGQNVAQDTKTGEKTVLYQVRPEYHMQLREMRDTVPFIGRF